MATLDATDLFWARIQRKAASLQPAQSRAFLKALDFLRERLTGSEVERLVSRGDVGGLHAILDDPTFAQAFARFRAQMQITTRDAVSSFGVDIPGASRGTIAFDVLDPKVIEAVRSLDSLTMQGLAVDTRETVRLAVEQGLRDGLGPRAISRGLRDVIGLGPDQLEQVANFRKALETGESVAGYTLRDHRLRTSDLTESQIDKAVEAYQRRRVAQNAETISRTATLDSLKLGQRLAWQDAVDKGIVTPGTLVKQWKGVMDDRERPEHVAMEGETVPFDAPYSNGEVDPGESTYNCRCVSIVYTSEEPV